MALSYQFTRHKTGSKYFTGFTRGILGPVFFFYYFRFINLTVIHLIHPLLPLHILLKRFFSPLSAGLLTLMLIASIHVSGQPIEFDRLSRLDGLPSNSVSAIVQDNKGFMWFGTRNGLVRYDGYSFRNYTYDPLDSLSLSDNYIRCLLRLSDGRLLIGTYFSGFCIYNPHTELFRRYKNIPGKNSLHNNNILTAIQDNEGIVWIGTWDGFDRFDPATEHFQHFSFTGQQSGYNPAYVSSIVPDNNGKLLLYGPGNKIGVFDASSRQHEFFRFSNQTFNQVLLNKGGVLLYDSKSNLWIGTESEGIYRLNTNSGEFIHYTFENKRITSNTILAIYEDSEGIVWLATNGGGLGKYLSDSDQFVFSRHNPTDNKSLSSDVVSCIYETEPGILWVGSYGAGINQYKKQKRFFRSFTSKSSAYEINVKSVLAFEQADHGMVWIGTDGGGLDLFDPQKKTLQNFSKAKEETCFDIIKSLYRDPEGQLWMGSYGSGICLKNQSGLKAFHAGQADTLRSLSKPSVWSICGDRHGQLWLGLMDNALDIYQPASGTFRHIRSNGPEQLPPGSVHVVFRDSKDRMWIGSEVSGLALYDEKNDRFIPFNLRTSHGLKSDNINEIKEIDGILWIGYSNGGVSQLRDEEKKIFHTYTTDEGLAGNSVFGIEYDTHGNLWISTENGISRLNPASGEIRNFDVYDGLMSNEFTYGASFKDHNGYMYFGSVDGFVFFHPDSILFNEQEPVIMLTGLKIANREIKPGKKYGDHIYLKQPVDQTREVTLTHDDYMVTLEFAALEYSAPLKSRYAYMLEGFDTGWVYTDPSQRQATYTNLPAGTYTFRVKATNNHGKWNEEGICLTLTILPPWWDTMLFRVLAAMLITGGLLLLIIVKTITERKRRKELEETVAARTAELKHKNEELNRSNLTKDKLFSIVSHDLRGPANSVEALSSMVLKHFSRFSEEDKLEALSQLHKASKSLSGLVSTLFTWARLHNHSLVPVSTRIAANEIIQKNIDLVDLQAKGKSIRIEYHKSKEELYILADKDMADTILRNILANAIKFTENGGLIRLSAERTPNRMIKIEVRDNGIGMDQDILEAVIKGHFSKEGTQGESGSGLGLVVCKDFAEANGGFLKIASTVGEGSIFEIHLPESQTKET